MKVFLWSVVALLVIGALMVLFGPRAGVEREIAFDPASLGEDLDIWLEEREAAVPNLRPGVEKRIRWAGESGARTPLSIVYLHGFSATSEEIRPVPDKVAAALGANLFFNRFSGHGRDGAAMAEPVAGDWVEDMAEALAIGRRLGDRVLIIATSAGGTLATIAAVDPDLSRDVAGLVLVSPNYRPTNPAAGLLTWPWARHWVPLVVGGERGFEVHSEDHAAFWTSRYPTVATIPMMALVDHIGTLDLKAAQVPALFLYSEHDRAVSAEATDRVVAAWGGPTRRELRVMGPQDDPGSHVITGDILSPGQTAETIDIITDWASGL